MMRCSERIVIRVRLNPGDGGPQSALRWFRTGAVVPCSNQMSVCFQLFVLSLQRPNDALHTWWYAATSIIQR